MASGSWHLKTSVRLIHVERFDDLTGYRIINHGVSIQKAYRASRRNRSDFGENRRWNGVNASPPTIRKVSADDEPGAMRGIDPVVGTNVSLIMFTEL